MMARTPREDVMKQVFDDLDFAQTWLPDIDASEITNNWGHVSKQAATAMIVRSELYEGTFSKYHSLGSDYAAHLQKSITAAESLINGRKFELYPNFQDLFMVKAEGRQNKENIFVKAYGPNGSGATTKHDNSRKMENAATLTRNMVDLFLYTDGLPREKSPLKISPETSFDDVFSNRDPRLGMTIYRIGEDAYKGAYTPFSFRNGYNLKKGFDLEQWGSVNNEWTDKMIIRYAEVLISYAEALYELNGSITDAQLDQTVNAIRSRAGMPGKTYQCFCHIQRIEYARRNSPRTHNRVY